MKNIIMILAIAYLPLLATSQDEEQSIEWMSFEQAIKKSKKNPKPIFIDLYTDWCGWCKKMDATTFEENSVVTFMKENFYNVKFDAEYKDDIVYNDHTFKFVDKGKNGYHELAASLLQGKMSYPSFVILNKDEQVMKIIKGFHKSGSFMKILESLSL